MKTILLILAMVVATVANGQLNTNRLDSIKTIDQILTYKCDEYNKNIINNNKLQAEIYKGVLEIIVAYINSNSSLNLEGFLYENNTGLKCKFSCFKNSNNLLEYQIKYYTERTKNNPGELHGTFDEKFFYFENGYYDIINDKISMKIESYEIKQNYIYNENNLEYVKTKTIKCNGYEINL